MKHKYPRTFHLPWSQSIHSDDKVINNYNHLIGKEIIVSEKIDGENTSFGKTYLHARSLDSTHNFTRDWVKKLHSVICHDIPEGYRFCGENVAFYHSIHYKELESFYYLFSIWDENNKCLSWDDTMIYADTLDLATPKIIYRGIFDLDVLKNIAKNFDTSKSEGFVVRLADAFSYDDFSLSVTKWVRADHVQPNENGITEHWLKNTYPNELANPYNVKPLFMSQTIKNINKP